MIDFVGTILESRIMGCHGNNAYVSLLPYLGKDKPMPEVNLGVSVQELFDNSLSCQCVINQLFMLFY